MAPAVTPARRSRLASRWTRVGGLALHARVGGEASDVRPAVVLVHGLVVSSRYMVPTAELLARAFRVYAPDLPGFGRSGKPSKTLAVRELADSLACWMDAIGLERAALLGNSFGCQVVADFAVRHPERVDRGVLAGPTVDPTARSAVRISARWLGEVPRDIWMAPILLADLASAGARRSVGTFAEMMRDRIEENLPHVHAPTLVVRGSGDHVATQRWVEEAVALLPNGRLAVIPGAGHALNFHAPRELVRVVTPFLLDGG